MRDAANKRRTTIGVKNAMARLTEADVVAVRRARESGASLLELATRYGVSVPTVSLVINRKTWKHI